MRWVLRVDERSTKGEREYSKRGVKRCGPRPRNLPQRLFFFKGTALAAHHDKSYTEIQLAALDWVKGLGIRV